MALRVFVTRELFPFTAGGIGRVIANILATSSQAECEDTAVLYVGDGVDERAFRAVYPAVRFLAVRESDYRHVDDSGWLYPPKHSFSTSWLHWESVLVLQGLRRLERLEGPLGYIEFIDWGAAGFATVQEKRLGRGFADSTLAVRLHTTDSVLAHFEQRVTDVHGLALYDLERKALADCDMIVGQLEPVSEAMRVFYGFEEHEWRPRVVIHAPPVLLDAVPHAERAVDFMPDTPLVFSSKLQDIKRPDVFVRGCVQFMLANPGYKGEVRFLAHAFDSAYQAKIKALVPEELEDRFVFMRGLTGLARERVIAGSVCIFPSPWESFCLAAYEASMSGALCVVNRANPAFGDATPWVAGRNCIKFDGGATDLGNALTAAFSVSAAQRLEPVQVPRDPSPWAGMSAAETATADRVEITMVVVNHADGAGLLATLDSIAASSRVPEAMVVVDDGSTDALSSEVLERLEESGVASLQVVRLADHCGAGAAFNAALTQVDTPLVGFTRAGSVLAPDFLDLAAEGLSRNPGFDFVTGQHGYGATLEEAAHAAHADPARYWVVHGDARASGHVQNRYAADAFIVRTSRAWHCRFDEALGDRASWEFLLRCVSVGARGLVASNVVVTRRADVAVDARAGRQPWAVPVAYGELMRGKHLSHGRMSLPAYAFGCSASGGSLPDAAMHEYQRLYMELRSSETVRTALFIAESLQRRVPWLLAAMRRIMPLAVRLRRR